MSSAAAPATRVPHAVRAWGQNPRLAWPVFAAFAALLALRKPSALLTPQLWAEDGSIFLAQNDQLGLRALVEPYQGYLHTLPRLIAWAASHLADPAWWPLLYNGAAGALALAVIARTFSPRLALPGKPALALALLLGARTGEVLFNITNLQFVTAAALVQQIFFARPRSAGERAGDLAVLALVGLTGPFSVLFAPLFAWRWWRERHADNLVALLVVAGCGAVQGWLVLHGPAVAAVAAESFHPAKFLEIAGSRLVAWPLAGEWLVRRTSPVVVAVTGGAILAAVLFRATRPHARREQRVLTAVALVLLVAAATFRARFDTWEQEDFDSGERYFYLPRVLLWWLVAGEFDATSRTVRWLARGAFVLGLISFVPGYVLPAPPDYHWAEHCEPIRRGVPAKIPTLPEGWTLEYPGRPAGS
jgi:hypothetical protein